MNPSDIFGRPPNNTNQPGNPFQSFAQQNPAQGVGFGQPSVFSQPAFGQPTPQPSVFGQTPTFGQTSGLSQGLGQTSSFTFLGTAPAFGQSSLGQGTLGFGLPPPSYSQATGQNQMSAFDQTSAFVQSSAFGLSSSASQSLTSFSSTVTNQPSFSQLSAFSVPTATSSSSTGGRTDNPAGGNQFSFKPPNDAVFKPIFSVSPEPPSSHLGSLFSCVKPSALGFSFSQPFTFSQPANPSSSSTPASQPTTPSTFSFTAQSLQSQSDNKIPAFGTGIGSFGFGDPKTEAPQRTEDRAGDGQSSGGETAFVAFGIKRKEEPVDPNAAKSDSSEAGADEPRQPAKRPLLRSRGPAGGLFRNALSELMKSKVSSVKREDHLPDRPDPPGPGSDVATTPPRSQAPTVLKKAEEVSLKPEAQTLTPGRRASRKESTDSLAGLSPTDATVIQCKGIPPNLNKKDLIIQHFRHFGKVLKVYCRPQKNLAIVHFQDHTAAAKAKKKGKQFQRTEIQIFWQRKKQIPLHDSYLSYLFISACCFCYSSLIQKSSVAKTLQFESEALLESVSEERSVERPIINLPSVLQPLIGQVAETAEERYRLLEQRDKILRQARPKRTDLDMSKVFVGTCPDMCPEKERYMRETRNQLSVFEVIPDTEKVDHFAAIKEYSRSSADQEEPLPHELRPLPVLSMTMDYLVTQIMDQGEGNYRDWYDFVWNRTRGIRKDITQQHLCDPETVSLIEKCTRFHIHCAHHLCQEPMMSFDAKINNENMTKCLQSLKEMYQDLATKEVYCPNEAEFRQYNVLLKLNDGDILREVQQFRKEVRESREVDFAVQACAALNSNNFVRFFKLVSAASYLSSCILHRYFNQVRSKALKILNVAFTVGSQRSTIFPLEDFVRMLMFRNATEAADFIQQYGLTINDGMVELSRTAYQEPDFSLPQRKSVVIERKRTVLIGEVVNGGPLPNPPQHNPVCSFDSNKKYTGDGLSSEPPPTTLKGVDCLCLNVSAHVFCSASDSELETVVSEVLNQLLRELSTSEIIAEKERIADEKRKQEEARCVNFLIQCFCFCKPVCIYFRWRDVVAVRRQLKRQMRGFPAAPGCVDPRFKLKALIPSAPTSPSLDLLAQGMVNLGNSGNMAVSCTRLLKMRQEAVHQMKVSYYYNLLLSERVWMPLDMPTLVAESTPNAPDRIFWKATLLLPSSCDSDISYASRILTDWLEVKLGGENQSEESEKELKGQLKTLCISHSLTNIRGQTHEVHIAIKACHGPLSAEDQCLLEEHELHGTNALLMLLPPLNSAGQGEEDEDVSLLSALLQLRQVQQASCWHSPVPLVVVVIGNQEGGTNDHALMLNMLVNDGLISEYIFVHIPATLTDLQGSEQVGLWLAARSPAGPALYSQTLLQVVELGLCREFYSRLHRDKQDRKHAGLPSQHPEPIVQLCNSVLSFLAGVVSSEHLSSLCWPPPEFSLPENRELIPHQAWNPPEHLEWLKRTILSRQLPEWDLPPISASWPHLCASIFQYVSQIPTSPLSQPILMSRLENLLRRVNYQYFHVSDADWEDYETNGPSFHEIPWDDIISLCVEHRMKDWSLETLVSKDALTDDGEILVYFNKDSLKCFQPPDSWIEAVKQTYQEKQLALEVRYNNALWDCLFSFFFSFICVSRIGEQIQRRIEADHLSSASFPLFLPSTLLSAPPLVRTSSSKRPAATFHIQVQYSSITKDSMKLKSSFHYKCLKPAFVFHLKEVEMKDSVEKTAASCEKNRPVSLFQRLQDLKRELSSQKEEERVCDLKLKCLLDIVEN
uniref:Germinal-center associated nuclear protein n=1 Tax=Sinocyclocheilus rhinocerous TaxID=307959 RepID=A0A673HID2_9TELE